MQKEILGFRSICHKLKGMEDMKKSEKCTKPKKFVYKDIKLSCWKLEFRDCRESLNSSFLSVPDVFY